MKEDASIRKFNMKLYPIYVIFGSDLLFFYGTRVLYLAQVKNISDANIVFLSTLFALISIIGIILADIINIKKGNRKTLIIGDCIAILSIFIFILGKGFTQIAIAQMLTAVGFAMKNISIAPLLRESIPETKYKDQIFSKIDRKAYFSFCVVSALSLLVSGYLYDINKYIPMILCFICTVISLIISINFKTVENVKKSDKEIKKSLEMLKEGFSYLIKSKRLKALLISLGFIWGIFTLYGTYQSTLLKNMNMQATDICIIGTILDIIRGFGGRLENKYNQKYKNKSLTILSIIISLAFIIAGIGSLLNINFIMQILIIVLAFFMIEIIRGIYMVLYKRYVNNFSNEKILPTLYTMTNIFWNFTRVIITVIGSFVLTIVDIKKAFIIIGGVSILCTIVIAIYMKGRIGLNKEEYNKEDLKYADK